MPIHDLSYKHWQGERTRTQPAWILGRAQLSSVLKRRSVRFLLLAGGLLFLAYLIIIWVEALALRGGSDLPDFLVQLAASVTLNGQMLQRYLEWQIYLHVLLCIAGGADLLALDRRYRALQLYLARPLRVPDYLLGKAMPMLLLLSLTSWIPAMLLIGLKTIATTDIDWLVREPWIPWSVLLYAVVLIGSLTLLTLAISCTSPSPRLASAQLFVFVALTRVAAEILTQLTSDDHWRLMCPLADLRQVSAWLFQQPLPSESSPWLSVLALIVMAAGSIWLLRKRVRAVDIVGES
jgi:hypothetical protein